MHETDIKPRLNKHRLVLFSGKGGVGKTTAAAAFAIHCANQGMKTLLMQINAEDHLGAMFGKPPIGENIVPLRTNLFAVNSTPTSAMREYALMTLKIKIIYRAVFENKIVKAFLSAVPGISEIVLLGKAYYHAAVETESKHSEKKKWDIVIIDAPATGHGIFLLKIPSVITSIITSGHMYEEALRMQKMLEDPEFTSVNIVTLLEELPINETEMLLRTLRDELNISVDYIISNRVLSNPFENEEIVLLNEEIQKEDVSNASIIQPFLEAGRFRLSRFTLQKKYKDLLATKTSKPTLEIPQFFHPLADQTSLEEISTYFDAISDNRTTEIKTDEGAL